MILLDDRTNPTDLDRCDAHPRVTVSATASFLDAEGGDEQ